MSVTGVNSDAAQPGASVSPRNAVMKSMSDLLGMSQDDIRAALKNGSSLADLAQTKGITSDQLVDAITQALGSTVSSAGAPASAGDLRDLAQKIADQKGLPQHRHHHRGHHGDAAPPASTTGGTSGVDLYA